MTMTKLWARFLLLEREREQEKRGSVIENGPARSFFVRTVVIEI
jgi:hypothetical protein